MTLHNSKRTAILQLCNSLSSLDLVNIHQLADCKYFCDLISSVFKISPELQLAKDPGGLNAESIVEKSFEDALKNIKVLATDLNIDDKELGDKPITVVENETSESKKVSENIRNETRSSVRRGRKKKSLSNFDPDSKSAPEIPASTPEIQTSAPEIPASTSEIPASTSNSINDIANRYIFLKKFIDDTYIIESSKIIMYSLCVKSDELELAKVAIIVLSSVVKHHLSSKNDVLNTLALLDHEVQDDIKECLSLFLLQDKKITKDEIEYILTKPAQYKKSPRSPRYATTPPRSCSSKYKKSVLATTPSAEDVFSDSPLKSFFDSPNFQNRELLIKELAKTRKMFLAEEQRSEDLMLEVKSLKKKLESKDKDNKVLKEKLREDRLKEETYLCKSCEVIKIKLDEATANLQQQKESSKDQEKEISKLTSIISVLEARIKSKNRNLKMEQSLKTHSPFSQEAQNKIIVHLEIENKILEGRLNELREELNANKSLLQEKISEAAHSMEPVAPVAGECLGSVIEEENRQLQTKLCKLESMIENLLKQKCVNSQGVEIINQELNNSAINQSDLSMPVLMDVPEIPNAEKDTNVNSDAETDKKGEPSLSNDCNLNIAEIVDNNTSSVLNDSNLNDVDEIGNKVATSVSNDCNLKNGEIDKNALSLSINCDILTSMPEVIEEKQACDSSLRKRKSSAVFEAENVPVVNTGIGSLWSQYNDSGSEWESTVGVSFPHNANGFSRQDLLKQLGFSEAEYSTKLGIAKKLWDLFKELFTTNGSNGFVGLSLKSDEDYIMCLLPIREYLFRFQNNNSIPKNCVLPDKILCNCDSMSDVKELKKENEEIKIKLSESESYAASYIEQKDAERKELLSKLDAMQQKYQELIKTNEDFHSKNKVLLQKHESLKKQMAKMMSKISETDEIKNQCANLLNSKNEAEQSYKRRLKLCHDKIISFDMQKREFQAAIEKEKKLKRDMISQIQSLKSEVMSLKRDRKCLERGVKELKSENMRLSSYIEAMKEKGTRAVKNNVVSCSIPIHHNSRPQYDKNSEININVKVQGKKLYKTESVHDMSVASSSYPSTLMPLDASQMSASFNKSLHSFALITDDEEEYSFQGGSLAEIKKEYDSTVLTGKERRITELHRRNTMYLPHMQSSYPIELQSMSPFSQKLLENVEKLDEKQETEKNEVPVSSVTSHYQALKKRKVEDIEPECEAGPSQLPKTPVKAHKHFKTPSSLQKLLRSYRPKSRRPIPKPKS